MDPRTYNQRVEDELLEDIILDLDGYYPHQMAQKIIERLTAAGYQIVHVPEGDVSDDCLHSP